MFRTKHFNRMILCFKVIRILDTINNDEIIKKFTSKIKKKLFVKRNCFVFKNYLNLLFCIPKIYLFMDYIYIILYLYLLYYIFIKYVLEP